MSWPCSTVELMPRIAVQYLLTLSKPAQLSGSHLQELCFVNFLDSNDMMMINEYFTFLNLKTNHVRLQAQLTNSAKETKEFCYHTNQDVILPAGQRDQSLDHISSHGQHSQSCSTICSWIPYKQKTIIVSKD